MKVNLIYLFVLMASLVRAADYWVGEGGNDDNPGSEAEPFGTLQHGVDTAESGDTVWVKAGVYGQRVSMKSGVKLRGSAGGGVILDGSELTVGSGWDAIVSVVGARDVLIERARC